MAKSEATTTVYTCDGCGKTRTALGEQLPDGYHGGSVRQVGRDTGNQIPEWYADRKECIGKAVRNAFNADQNTGNPEPPRAAPVTQSPGGAVQAQAATANPSF